MFKKRAVKVKKVTNKKEVQSTLVQKKQWMQTVNESNNNGDGNIVEQGNNIESSSSSIPIVYSVERYII
jgi:hypothetical protein